MGIKQIVGKWPGDESEEEILNALAEGENARTVALEAAQKEIVRLQDMAAIGEAFMARLPKDYHWNECPTEYLTDLINERDEALKH